MNFTFCHALVFVLDMDEFLIIHTNSPNSIEVMS